MNLGNRTRKRIRKGIHIVILSVILFLILIPLWWAVSISFDNSATVKIPEFRWWPRDTSLRAYEYAFKIIPLLRLYGNTLMISVINTVISVFSAMCCGYAFSKGRFFGKKFWYMFMMCVMMIPFESRMVPLYLQYQQWGMINTYWPLILGNFAYVFGMIFATTNISSLPDSLCESASLDGASRWRIFLQIILPLSKPVIAALSILQIISHWNSYLWPMIIIRKTDMQMLSVGISYFNATESSRYFSPRMAVAVMGSIPLIIIFLCLQKYIVESIAMTGIKQ